MPQESWESAQDSFSTHGIQGTNKAKYFARAQMCGVRAGRRQREQKLKPGLRQEAGCFQGFWISSFLGMLGFGGQRFCTESYHASTSNHISKHRQTEKPRESCT